VPSDVFVELLDPGLRSEIGDAYLDRVQSIEYHTAVCMLLELDRVFGPHYWTNVIEDDIPFIGLIEQTNLIPAEVYGGRRFLYIANYVEPGDELLELSPDELFERYEPGIRRVNPDFSQDWIKQMWLFKEPAAQPIVDVGYAERMPPLQTGVAGLVLANTTQIYPEDRGTNYSVRLGTDAVEALAPSLN
jgi:protoporphyrinogen oxidase